MTYVVVHARAYESAVWRTLEPRLAESPALAQLGRFADANGPAAVYRLR